MIVNCKECDEPISSHAKVCPKCGAPDTHAIGKTAGLINRWSRPSSEGIFLRTMNALVMVALLIVAWVFFAAAK